MRFDEVKMLDEKLSDLMTTHLMQLYEEAALLDPAMRVLFKEPLQDVFLDCAVILQLGYIQGVLDQLECDSNNDLEIEVLTILTAMKNIWEGYQMSNDMQRDLKLVEGEDNEERRDEGSTKGN